MDWKIKAFLWWAVKVLKFDFIDLKHSAVDSDELEAITFSWDEEYINKVNEIE